MLCAALVALTGAPASAGAAEYDAHVMALCCDFVMEPGDVTEAYFRVKNVGTATWTSTGPAPVVDLGNNNPQDRDSDFWVPEDWSNPQRPTGMDVPAIAFDQQTNLSFLIKAPQTPGAYEEHFRLVAEGREWFGPDMWMTWTVVPAESPRVTITQAPANVLAGEPIAISAQATDNTSIDRVTFTLGQQTVEASVSDSTWTAFVPTIGLPAGAHTVVAHAFDQGGRERTAEWPFQIVLPAPYLDPLPALVQAPSVVPTAPLPRLRSDAAIRGRAIGRRGVRITSLKVAAPPGSRITVRCKPRRCRPITIRRTRRPRTRIAFPTKRVLPLGTRILVRVTKPGARGEETVFTIAPGDVTKRERPLP